MNILQVISSSRTSGAEKHLVILSQSLQQMGHRVTAVCPPGGWLPSELERAGIPAIQIPMHGSKATKSILALKRAARENDIDVIHTHLTRATYLGYFAGSLARVPVISTMHVLTKDFAYRWLPKGNHSFVTVSDYLRGRLIERGLPAGRVETVYNGTDLGADDRIPTASTLSVRAELGVPADAELVGQIGRVDSFKGAPILVRSVKGVVERCPRAYFVFVGQVDPQVQQGLWEMASADGVDDRLRFIGVRDDVPRLLREIDVVTLPSINEACSMAIIEAMTLGKPVVATRAGGNLELVDEGRTGLLVDRSSGPLSEALIDLLSNAERRAAMGAAAAERATRLFSAEAMAQNMEGVYRRILHASRGLSV